MRVILWILPKLVDHKWRKIDDDDVKNAATTLFLLMLVEVIPVLSCCNMSLEIHSLIGHV